MRQNDTAQQPQLLLELRTNILWGKKLLRHFTNMGDQKSDQRNSFTRPALQKYYSWNGHYSNYMWIEQSGSLEND